MHEDVRGGWIGVTTLTEVPTGQNKAFKVGEKSILVCHSIAGVFAVENRCTHQLAVLEGGKVRGTSLFCPKHGAQFDLRSGAPIGPLARAAIQTFKTRVHTDGRIDIEMYEQNRIDNGEPGHE